METILSCRSVVKGRVDQLLQELRLCNATNFIIDDGPIDLRHLSHLIVSFISYLSNFSLLQKRTENKQRLVAIFFYKIKYIVDKYKINEMK